MSRDHRKILGGNSQVMMSESLQKIIRPIEKEELQVYRGNKCVVSFSKVHWFQKSSDVIEVSCGVANTSNIFALLQDISHTEILRIDYCGVSFKKQACKQWRFVSDYVDPMGGTRVELIFSATERLPDKEILND